jgi:hypothetical protein
MLSRLEQYESPLEAVAKALWCLAVLAGVLSLIVQLLDNARRQVRVEQRQEEHRRLAQQTVALVSEISLKHVRAEQIGREVIEQSRQRSQVVLDMDQVLARATSLREQRDKFESTREDVQRHFRELDADYGRASRLAPGIQPP